MKQKRLNDKEFFDLIGKAKKLLKNDFYRINNLLKCHCPISIRYKTIYTDYPDIISLEFVHRKYTEDCDDMEGYFRANLYHLLNQSENIFTKSKINIEESECEFKLFIYSKPILIFSERIASQLKYDIADCFIKTLRLLIVYKHLILNIKQQHINCLLNSTNKCNLIRGK